ncbi:MAG: hypothetical protein IPM54_01155 [Polyangiaceae bacterium]|nr:hypothetical protein [Polyangiaceae bacterium]
MKVNRLLLGGAVAISMIAPGPWSENAKASSSSPFNWTMQWRLVNGRTNKRFHVLEAGTLTLSGKLWIHEKRRGAPSRPMRIKIEVVKESNDGTDSDEKNSLCSVIVTPSTTLHERTEYSKSCGRIETGKYWIRVNKFEAESGDGDGWHNQGSGILVTE